MIFNKHTHSTHSKRRYVDHRTRRDRNERRHRKFQQQMKALVDAKMQYDFEEVHGRTPTADKELIGKFQKTRIVDVYGLYLTIQCEALAANLIQQTGTMHVNTFYPLTDTSPGPQLIKLHGAIPTAPITPSVAISIKALELYRCAKFRCPHFSVQAFVKTMLDVQEVCKPMCMYCDLI